MNRVTVIREATGKIIKMLSEKKNLEITQRGSRAFVKYNEFSGEPERINIPYIPDDASEEFLNAIQGFLDHEVAHVLFTDFGALKKASEEKIANLHNIIEDSFIERQMAKRFSGCSLNLRNVGEFFLKTYTDKELLEHPENTRSVLFVPAIRAWAGQSIYAEYMKDKWHLFEDVTNALGESVNEVKDCNSSWDCLDVARKFKKLLSESKKQDKDAGNDSGESEEKDDSNKQNDKKKGGKGQKDKNQKGNNKSDDSDDDDFQQQPDELDDADDEQESSENDKEDSDGNNDSGEDSEGSDNNGDEESDKESSNKQNSSKSELDGVEGDTGEDNDSDGDGDSDMSQDTDDGEGGNPSEGNGAEAGNSEFDSDSFKKSLLEEIENNLKDFDEAIQEHLSSLAKKEIANSSYVVYTKDFDRIEPYKAPSSFPDRYITDMESKVDHMLGPLQKDIERAIAAKSKVVWTPGYRSGRLSASHLAKLVKFNDDRVFRRKVESTSKDVAVSLLIDCSGSMTTKDKLETASFATYALSSVLDRIGIANEVLGFTTGNSHYLRKDPNFDQNNYYDYARTDYLYMPILKSFSEKMNGKIKTNFASLSSASFPKENVDGECVEIAANRLAARGESRKILIVLSDGQPATHNYVKPELQRHLRETVLKIEKAGMDVLGIGIVSEAVKQYYSKYVVLNRVSDLPTVVMTQMKGLLIK